LALVGTWGNNIAYVGLGFIGTNVAFWQDTLANPASRSITVDLFFRIGGCDLMVLRRDGCACAACGCTCSSAWPLRLA
jgi:hypothetical protein